MQVEQELRLRLEQQFLPTHISIVNESSMHSVPENSETHFKVILVSDQFENMRSVARHQKVFGLIPDMLNNPIHALSLHLYTPDEWSQTGTVTDSPQCLGGSRAG